MPTAGAHVDDDFYKEIKETAAEDRKGVSAFVKEAILEKMEKLPRTSSMPTAKDAACLVQLCEAFAPTYANEMRERVEGVDQPKALEMLLKQYAAGMLGLSDEFLRSSYPLKAAEDGGEYPNKKGGK